MIVDRRGGADTVVKIVVREGLKSQRVYCVRVGALNRRQVRELLLGPSACFCDRQCIEGDRF
jgi:hypothetical protein